MSNDKAMQKSLEKSLSLTSLDDLVRARTSETAFLLLDCSISMDALMRNGKSRIQGLREVVAQVRTKQTYRMVAFGPMRSSSSYEQVFFTETVPDPGGSTPLAEAIEFAGQHGAGRLVVISDGRPNDSSRAMDAAKKFGGQVDVMYVGDPGDAGSAFLDELANATGGSRFEGDLSDIKRLSGAIIGLLAGEVMEEVDDDEEAIDAELDEEDGDEDGN